jgi:hypothetical protein
MTGSTVMLTSLARASPRLFDGCAPGLDDLCHRFDGGDARSGLARIHGHCIDMAFGGRTRREPVPLGQGDALAAHSRFARRVASKVAQRTDA